MEVPWPLVCAGSKPINRLQVLRKIWNLTPAMFLSPNRNPAFCPAMRGVCVVWQKEEYYFTGARDRYRRHSGVVDGRCRGRRRRRQQQRRRRPWRRGRGWRRLRRRRRWRRRCRRRRRWRRGGRGRFECLQTNYVARPNKNSKSGNLVSDSPANCCES